MLIIDQIKCDISASKEQIIALALKKLNTKQDNLKSAFILKRSVDARKKPDLFYIYSVVVSLFSDEKKLLKTHIKNNDIREYEPVVYSINKSEKKSRPIVIGAGPAGLFAMYILSLSGLCPICLERGKKVEDRKKDVETFWETGVLNTASNVQFGEGGAGTFSDGKLNTLVKDKEGRNRFVLETFVKFGANEDILIDAKPHIGTDVLLTVVANMRKEIESLGGEFLFETCVEDFILKDNKITGVKTKKGDFLSDYVVLAIGHSARDTFEKLYDKKVIMEAKDFAVGFRIEHPQDFISETMYGPKFRELPAASYKLAHTFDDKRGVYSFCMCPGGHVVNSSSEKGMLAVNGMSYSGRNSGNSNSAIVISVGEKNFDKTSPLSGIAYQRQIEKMTFDFCNGLIPQQLWGDFVAEKMTSAYGSFSSITKGGVGFGPLHKLLGNDMNDLLKAAMVDFGHKIKGFDRNDAILSGVESRTSSPVRIWRGDDFVSVNIKGLYPCGEGAGYAGGIMSAAMDGMKVAEAIING